MDGMLSYCGGSSFNSISSTSSNENDDYRLFEKNLMKSLNSAANLHSDDDAGERGDDAYYREDYYQEQIDSLMAQCERYRAVIKRQEREIADYREHIEHLEDENSKMANSLTEAHRDANVFMKKVNKYERTIDSLRQDINSLQISVEAAAIEEQSRSQKGESISLSKLSFSDEQLELNSKVSLKEGNKKNWPSLEALGEDTDDILISNMDTLQLIVTVKEFCKQIMDLKQENDSLRAQVRQLTVDNEDYRNQLWDRKPDLFHDSQLKRISTPIKNFISYQALDLPCNNHSFSIDEDYECDNMVFDDNIYKHLSPETFEYSKMKELNISPIENEELPSSFGQSLMFSQQRSKIDSRFLFTDSMMMKNKSLLLVKEINSIENQKLPPSFDSFQSMKALSSPSLLSLQPPTGGGEKEKEKTHLPSIKFVERQPKDENDHEETEDETLKNVTVDDVRSITSSNRTSADLPAKTSSNDRWLLTSWLIVFLLHIHGFYSRFYWIIFMILFSMLLTYHHPKFKTQGIIPFYSIEEVVTDVLEQFFRADL